jgi:sec-independent protein translocase protein TatC
MAKNSRDLFDETTMSFGEHLEALRIHLWKAIIGFVLCVCVTLFFGEEIVHVMSQPLQTALREKMSAEVGAPTVTDDLGGFDFIAYVKSWFTGEKPPEIKPTETKPTEAPIEEKPAANPLPPTSIAVQVAARELVQALALAKVQNVPDASTVPADQKVSLVIDSPVFAHLQAEIATQAARIQKSLDLQSKPVVLTVQEAFMAYLKVSMVAGFVLASPWVFYQVWLFVAAGLYPHERRYVHIYLPFSLLLFLFGAVFCYFAVLPFMLDFLLGFAGNLEATTQIRLSEWLGFALIMPVMFGVSFQLPLVMMFLERINIFTVDTYKAQRRMAILVIAIASMVLTPSPETASMLLMMFPLLGLYELGILLCGYSVAKSPFETEAI